MIIGREKLEEMAKTLIDENPDSEEDKSVELLTLPDLGELYIHYFGIRECSWHKKIRSLLLRNRQQNIGISQSRIIGIEHCNDGPYNKPINVYRAELNVLETKHIPHYNFPGLTNDRALYVEPNFRGRGFGRGLISLNFAILCEENRCYSEKYRLERMPACLDVLISQEDENLIQFYEQIGFRIEDVFGCGWKGRYLVPPQEIPPFVVKEFLSRNV
jgi:GNAT superfamily N-acetyltransferase